MAQPAKTPDATPINNEGTGDTTGRLGLLKSRLELAQAWSKKPHQAWKRWIQEYEIDDLGDTEEIRDKVRIGYVFRRIESDLPAIFDDQPDLFFKGKNTQMRQVETLFEGAYDWLWDTQDLEEKIEDAATYFLLLGMGFIESPWVTKTKTVQDPQAGELTVPLVDNPVAEVPDPFKIYFSPETKFGPVMDYDHCPGYFKEKLMTTDAIKAKWKKKVDATETLHLGDTEADQTVADQKENKADIKRVTVFEYWGCLPEENAKGVKGAGAWSYDKDYHVFFTNKEELFIEECPYEIKPLFILGNYGMANKFWKFGDAKHLIPLVQEYQQYRTHILQYTRKAANPKPLISEDSGIDEDAFNDPRVGRPVRYTNTPPSYLEPGQLSNQVQVGAELAKTDLEQVTGSFQLAQGSDQSTVKTPRGIQVFSEAADKNVRRKRKKVARFIRQIILFQFKQLSAHWKPEDGRTLEVINPDMPGGTEQTQVTALVLQTLGADDILAKLDIEVESLSVNKVQMKQDSLDLWDLASAHPDIFNLQELAKDMLQNGFGKKDGDRFLVTDAQRQQMAAAAKNEPPRVSVAISADAATPPGAALLEKEGLLAPGQGTQAVINDQVMQHMSADQNAQRQDASANANAARGVITGQASQPFNGSSPSTQKGGGK